MLHHSDVWGEDMLLAAPDLRQRHFPRAVSYLEVYYIGRDELLRIASTFSDTWIRLRHRIIFLALKRYTILLAKTIKSQNRAHARGLTKPSSELGSYTQLVEGTSHQDSRILNFVKAEIADAQRLFDQRKSVKIGSARLDGDRIDAVLSAVGALKSDTGNMVNNMDALQTRADQQQEMLLKQQEMLQMQQEMLVALRDEVQALRNANGREPRSGTIVD